MNSETRYEWSLDELIDRAEQEIDTYDGGGLRRAIKRSPVTEASRFILDGPTGVYRMFKNFQRLDLTLEAHLIMHTEFWDLFREDVLRVAWDRLEVDGFLPLPPVSEPLAAAAESDVEDDAPFPALLVGATNLTTVSA